MAVEIIRGFAGKPRACQKLTGFFLGQEEISGCLFVGYPFFDPLGLSQASVIDGLLISPEKGLVAFNLVEEDSVPRDYCERHDDVCQVIEWNLKRSGKLLKKRKLAVEVKVVTFAPNAKDGLPVEKEGCPICDEKTLGAALANITLCKPELYGEISLAVRTIGKSEKMIERKPLKPGSKGAYCAELEARSSLILDHNQIRAVMETEEGAQRIRGLSGSGKSTVLALKVAYVHACHPEWKIGVTYNTFSLREWYLSAITHFFRNQTGQAPSWDNITVCMAWGNENGKDQTAGMYQIFTDINSVRFYGFSQAKTNLGSTDPFAEA
ncbi:MAG: helicase, partial [Clostridiales bacterium]|nr:helicase [Clostridiales bacterium]